MTPLNKGEFDVQMNVLLNAVVEHQAFFFLFLFRLI